MRILTAIMLSLALFMVPLTGISGTFTESFDTVARKDSIRTTADWNTGTGALTMFPFAPEIIGSHSISGPAQAVAVVGRHAFVAAHSGGLQIFDISNPTMPVLLGTHNISGFALDVVVDGHMAFVADFTAGLQIVDVSDPVNPVLVGAYNTTGTARGVAVDGDRAYVADGSGGLQIIDISNLAIPVLVGTYNTPGIAYDVVISGQRAYVADGDSGLHIIDVTDSTSPVLIGTYNTTGRAYRAALSGHRVYIADGVAGMQIIDISAPASPVLVGTYSSVDDVRDVAISGDRAYLADGFRGLEIIDISAPALPVLLYTADTGNTADGVAISGHRAYVADSTTGLQVVTISYLANPEVLGSSGPALVKSVTVADDRAYGLTADGISIVDISNPVHMFQVARYLVSAPEDLAISGDYAYIAAGHSGLEIVSLVAPINLVGVYTTLELVTDVAVSGNRAYIIKYSGGAAILMVIDISNPTAPLYLGSKALPAPTRGLEVAGNYAYIISGSGGLYVIDIADPSNLTIVSRVPPTDLSTYFNNMKVSGDLVYIMDSNYDLSIVDVSNPASPSLFGPYNVGSGAAITSMAVVGHYVYLSEIGAMEVVDVSDSTNPLLAGSYLLESGANVLTVYGQRALVGFGFHRSGMLRIAQDEFDALRNIGQSFQLSPGASDTIYSIRLSAADADSTGWEVSADGGVNFQAVTPGVWQSVQSPGTDLRWRSTLAWTASGVNPSVASVTVDWLNPFARISSVSDLPNDQGKQVRVSWNRSGHDTIGDVTPITEYGVFRQIDPGLPKRMVATANEELAGLSPAARQHVKLMKAAGWDFLVTVPAQTVDTYAVVVPTVIDSTVSGGIYHTTFYVAALTATPGVFYSSPPDSGYSLDNLSPGLPLGIVTSYLPGSGALIDWQDAPEIDFQYYSIYRGLTSDFMPSAANLIQQTAISTWTDPQPGAQYFYKITATDYSGNESQSGSAGVVSGVSDQTLPSKTALSLAVPNPFNPVTTLSFDLATGGPVRLKVYDTAGHLVATLIDEVRAAGHHEQIWNGRDAAGLMSAAGVYLYRLDTGTYTETRRMTLVK